MAKRRAPTRRRQTTPGRASKADLVFLLRGNGRGLIVLIVLAFLAAFSEAYLLTAFVQGATALSRGSDDVVAHAGPISATVPLALFLGTGLAAATLRAVFAGISSILGPRVAGASRERHRRNLLESYVFSTWDAQAADRSGRLQQVFSTSINEVNAIVLTITTAMTALATLIVLLVVAFVLSQLITGLLLVVGVGIYLALRPLSHGARRAAHRDSEARVASASHVSVVTSAGAEILVLGSSQAVADEGRRRIGVAERAFARSSGLRQLNVMTLQSLAFVVAAAGLLAASLFQLPVDFTVLGTIALLLLRAAGQGNQVQSAFALFGQMSPFIAQVREMTAHFADNQRRFGGTRFPNGFDVALRQVTYRYPTSQTTVLDIPELTIEHGAAVAVLGPSGSGKSTLIQLLLRLRSTTTGTIRIGGVDVDSIDAEDFSRRVSFVPQAPHLIPGTIRENIRFYRPWVTDDQVETCARLAHVHEEIVRMPNGYDLELDSHVDMLSGGQKQRIALARALATDPSILVLDEPTSALDPTNEALVARTLAEMRGERTVVIITHRESTIGHCDMVLTMNRGRIEAHDPLAAARPHR